MLTTSYLDSLIDLCKEDALKTRSLIKAPMQKALDRLMDMLSNLHQLEAYRHVNLKELQDVVFTKATDSLEVSNDPIESCTLKLINGVYQEEASDHPETLSVYALDEALTIYSTLLSSRYQQIAEEEQDPLALLNHMSQPVGVMIHIPSHVTVEQTLTILDVIDSQTHLAAIQPKIIVYVGKGSHVKLNLKIQSDQKMHLYNRYLDFHLEEGASLKVTNDLQGADGLWHFDALRSHLKASSYFEYFGFVTGAKSSRQRLHVTLAEPRCEAVLKGLSVLDGKEKAHVSIEMHHKAPSATSHQTFKATVFDKARTSFEGKILVDSSAQFTEAYQVSRSLILGEHAMAFSQPNLEIFTDEVKASHGTTIAQLDTEPLFYLQSRGLSAEDSKEYLIKGFCQEMLSDREELIPAFIEKIKKALKRE